MVMDKNAGELKGKVKISKDDLSGSKRILYDHMLTYSRS